MPPDRPECEARLARLKVAVTGHGGFIGRYLTAALQALNVPRLCIEGDVRSPDPWTGEFSLLFHLAGTMPRRFREDPRDGFSGNIDGTLGALEACRARGARMILASTCGVYSPSVSGAVSEASPVDPRTPYAQSKLMAEMLCRSYAEHFGVACTILRLFNVFGAGQKQEFLIPYLLRCAVEGREAVVYHPESARDFVHAADVAQAMICAAVSGEHELSVFNIGSGIPYTVHQVIDVISEIVERPLVWTQGTGERDPQPAVYAEIQDAVRELGWRPVVALGEGLRRAIQGISAAGREAV